jgi:hypothetical protein
MKILPLCLLFLFTNIFELDSIRQSYIDAAVSQKSADAFHKSFEKIPDNHDDATLLAYKAASIVLLAKYEGGLISKTRLFNRGTDLLEAVLKKAPNNYEARLIRLNIQDNVPWITGYTSEIKQDKAFLIKNYTKQDEALKAFAKKYIMQCDAFSEKEKAQFK